MNGIVDAVKDPFLTEVNMNQLTANVSFMLRKRLILPIKFIG